MKDYRRVICPEEFKSMAHKNGQVRYSKLVMAKHLGRPLDYEEVVHHLDGNKQNCDISNLKLFPTYSDFQLYWHEKRAKKTRRRNTVHKNKDVKACACPEEFKAMAWKDGRIWEHRLAVAKAIGRPFKRKEVVHHFDENSLNNKVEQ